MSKKKQSPKSSQKINLEFKSQEQKMAWANFQSHDVLFLIGPAGCGKTYIATAFGMGEIISGTKKKLILTRPIVEAGENLGYLPGDFNEKVHPYMRPLFDSIDKLSNYNIEAKKNMMERVEVAPLAYLRGATLNHSVCILDEAQNATYSQLKLFLSRFGENSKVIITGDPTQSDIGNSSGLVSVLNKLESLPGIGVIKFDEKSIVRHPMVGRILERLND